MKNFLKNRMLKRALLGFSLVVVMVAGVFVYQAMADVASVTPATGGDNISIDKSSIATSPSFTTITGPTITETSAGQISVGTHYIDLPEGWESDGTFNIGKNGASDLGIGSSGYDALNHRIFFNITTASSDVMATLSFSFIKVRPTTDLPGTAYLTHSGALIEGVVDGMSFGTLNSVVGTATKIKVETAADGSGSIVSAGTTADGSITAYAISRDQFDNFVANVAADSWSLSGITGGVVNGDLVGAGSSAVFSGNVIGTAVINAAKAGLTATPSSAITVTPGAAHSITINTQPGNATGTVDFALQTQPIVTVRDTDWNPVVDGVTVLGSIGSGGGTLRNNSVVTAGGAGVATFTDLAYSKSGDSFTMVFVANSHNSATSASVTALTAGALSSILVSPNNESITTDQTKTFSAEGLDQYNNSKGDVTGSTVFTISAGAGGSFTGAVYNAQFVSAVGTPWTVTGTNGTIHNHAYLNVTLGALAFILISPDSSSITADDHIHYTAIAYDGDANPMGDVTGSTAFTIEAGAGGDAFAGNAYEAHTVSAVGTPWTVTGTYSGKTDTSSLTVTPGALASMEIATDNFSMDADSNTGFVATGFDADGNSKGVVTGDTTFSILHSDGTPDTDNTNGGSWTGPSYTAHTVGSYKVLGTNGAITHTTTNMTITPGAAAQVVVLDPTDGTVDADIPVTIQIQDADGNLRTDSSEPVIVTVGGSAVISGVTAGSGYSGSGNSNYEALFANLGLITINVHNHEAETINITVHDGTTLADTSSQSVVFSHGAATKYVIIDPTDGTVDASIPITVELQDQYGNLITIGDDKDKDVTLLTGGAATGYGTVNISNGTGVINISDQVAQTVGLTLSDNYGTGYNVTSTQNVVFAPGAANHLEYTVQPASTVVAGVVELTPTIVIHDQYSNVRTQSTDTITLSPYSDVTCDTPRTGGTLSGGTGGSLTKVEVSGASNFTGVPVGYTKTGNLYLKASDGTRTVCSTAVAVTHNTATKLALSASPTSLAMGANTTLTAIVQDTYGNTVTSDDTSVVILSADNGGTFPGGSRLTVASGTKTTTLTKNSAGDVNVNVTRDTGGLISAPTVVVTYTSTADEVLPVISGVSSTTAQTTAGITFQSNENGQGRLAYSTDGNTPITTDWIALTADASSTINLANLTCGTAYNYTIYAKDGSNNNADVSTGVFTTVACTPGDNILPVISGVSSTTAQTTASVNFQSNENGQGRLAYSTDGNTPITTDWITLTAGATSTINIASLACATTYEYSIYAKDGSNNNATSSNGTFTTAACTPGDTTAPPAPEITTATTTIDSDSYMISGTAGADTPSDTTRTIQVYNGATLAGTAYVPVGQESWSVNVSLNQNTTNSFTAMSYDAIGNHSSSSDAVVITETAGTEPTEISVTKTSLVKRIATKNGEFADGWRWVLDVTVPTASSSLKMSFDDLTGAGTIPAASNIRFYSTQSNYAAATNAILITAAGAGTAWSSEAMLLSSDLEAATPGRQIQITIQAAVPSDAVNGAYSASYDIQAY